MLPTRTDFLPHWKSLLVLIIIGGMMLPGFETQAGIYIRVSDSGTVDITNQPTDKSYSIITGGTVTENADQIQEIIDIAAGKYGMPRALILSVMRASKEQSKDKSGRKENMPLPYEVRMNSSETVPKSLQEKILTGTRYLRDMIQRYEGNLTLALAAYHAGPETVERIGGIPNKETRKWISAVRNSFKTFESREEIIYTYRDKNGVKTVVNISPSS